jgi:hypothetical protein
MGAIFFDILVQISNADIFSVLFSLRELRCTAGLLHDLAILDVLLDHFKLFEVLLEPLRQINR